jgi:hypothetical protein
MYFFHGYSFNAAYSLHNSGFRHLRIKWPFDELKVIGHVGHDHGKKTEFLCCFSAADLKEKPFPCGKGRRPQLVFAYLKRIRILFCRLLVWKAGSAS